MTATRCTCVGAYTTATSTGIGWTVAVPDQDCPVVLHRAMAPTIHAPTDELWRGDDPMRSCVPCAEGDHPACLDLIITPPYGMHACGCTNTTHKEKR